MAEKRVEQYVAKWLIRRGQIILPPPKATCPTCGKSTLEGGANRYGECQRCSDDRFMFALRGVRK